MMHLIIIEITLMRSLKNSGTENNVMSYNLSSNFDLIICDNDSHQTVSFLISYLKVRY